MSCNFTADLKRAPPLSWWAAAARAFLNLLVNLGVSRERFRLVHKDAAATRRAAELFSTDEPHCGLTALNRTKRGELKRMICS